MTPYGNCFSAPLKHKNSAFLIFTNLPLDKEDVMVLKAWIELIAANLADPVDDAPLAQPLVPDTKDP